MLSGCIASVQAVFAIENGNWHTVIFWILLGALFDFCDGFAARLLNAPSPIGKELDSLADLITFGLAPSLICFGMLARCSSFPIHANISGLVPYLGFCITIGAGIRLARFNIDTRQTTTFIGLPVPANAIFWCGLSEIFVKYAPCNAVTGVIIIALIVVFCYLMNCNMYMFSLKFKNLKWSDNKLRFAIIVLSILLTALTGMIAGAIIIVLYILMSVMTQKDYK